jgi:PAS domain S-box-containing protein
VDGESGKIGAANSAASTIYGYAREELLSMNWIDLSGARQTCSD